MRSIDLNADLGEGCGNDAALMPLISSCNVACGGHAGDAETMVATMALAQEHGVAVGAHPSYPDREGFGRRILSLDGDHLRTALAEQLLACQQAAQETGNALVHMKPHGALYNQAARDAALAFLVVEVSKQHLGDIAVVGPPQSELQAAASSAGLPFIAEGFLDRRYQSDGQLVPRSKANAMIADADARAAQALALASGKTFDAEGGPLQLSVQTLCLHGDTRGAVEIAQHTRSLLEKDGFAIRAANG